MSTFLEDFQAGLIAAIPNFWPAVTAQGIWEAESLDTWPWADTTIPFAVYEIREPMVTEDFGTVNRAYLAKVDIVYVDEADGQVDGLRQDINNAAEWLYLNNPANGQTISIDSMDWGDSVAGNSEFSEKDYPQRAAQISCTFLIGETGP
jgi:hypothetical protein